MDKVASYKEQIYKQAKEYSKTDMHGDYAIPKEWEKCRNSDDDEIYFREEHNIPRNFRPIADDGCGNSLFVDMKSSKRNPTYYDWDHETSELTPIHPNKVREMFSPHEGHEENISKLKALGIDSTKQVRELDLRQLKMLGYEKRKLRERTRDMTDLLPSTGGLGAAMGGCIGIGSVKNNTIGKSLKKGAKGALIGGAALGIPAMALGISEMRKNDKRHLQNYKDDLIRSIWKDEENKAFLSQYK